MIMFVSQIVFVHYSLAPEARYPVALNQCFAVYKWLRSHTSNVSVLMAFR